MRKAIQEISELTLWDNFISGNDEAFNIIYETHIQSLYRFGNHFTKSEELIFDCIHDVFIDLYKYRTNLNATNNIKLYLFVSLKRKLLKMLSEKGRFISLDDEIPPFYYSLSTSSDTDDGLQSEQFELLEKAMLELSNRQREAIYLRFVSGLSYEELGEVLQLNYQSARNLIFRGIEKLRQNCQKKSLILFWFLQKDSILR